MNQRISGYFRGMIALGPLPLRPVLGILLSCLAAEASMDNCRFALHYKPKFVASKTIAYLCDDPATTTIEPNYSPNWNSTTKFPNPLPCSSYDYTCEPMGPGQVYLVIGRAGTEGVSAASFGISYGGSNHVGIDPSRVTWTPCANGLSFPNSDGTHGLFPAPGGGLRITWDTGNGCPLASQEVIGGSGAHVVVGVFYVYAYSNDTIRITPNNNIAGGPELAVANCAGITTDLVQVWGLDNVLQYLVGSVGFNEYGFNPCIPINSISQEAPGTPCTTPITPTTWGKVKSSYRNDR